MSRTQTREIEEREVHIKVVEGNCQILENNFFTFSKPTHAQKPNKQKGELCGVRKAILNEY